jgi:hypothetical protein
LRIEALFLTALLWCVATGVEASLPILGEHLEYTLKFRGLITGYVELTIAKLTLQVEEKMAQVADTSAYITTMQLTTEPFLKAELLYPVRLNYRSWLDVQKLHPLVVVKSLRTREESEDFFWFDWDSRYAYHYQAGKESKSESELQTPPIHLQPVTSLSQEEWSALIQKQAQDIGNTDALDYMGLYYRLRNSPLESGRTITFSTYTGEKIENIHVDVKQEQLVCDGWNRAAFRLVLREIDPDSGDLGDEVQLWVSDDKERLLLRFYAKRTFGAIDGVLDTGRPEEAKGLSEATRSSLETYLDF